MVLFFYLYDLSISKRLGLSELPLFIIVWIIHDYVVLYVYVKHFELHSLHEKFISLLFVVVVHNATIFV